MLNVLIADDSSTMRAIMEMHLSELGHNVVGNAANGCEAILKYAELKPDVVTMDIYMPLMDGIDAVKVLKKSFKDATVIMTTAQGSKDMIKEALTAGAAHYIMKPLTIDSIGAAMEKVFPGQGMPRPAKEASETQEESPEPVPPKRVDETPDEIEDIGV